MPVRDGGHGKIAHGGARNRRAHRGISLPCLMVTLFAVTALQPASAAIEPGDCDQDWRLEAITQSFDYANDIQPIWTQFCANCHVDHAGSPLAGLDLDPPFSYSNLVNAPDGGLTIYLVAPGDPTGSLLFRKLNCNAPGPFVGAARMPLGRPILTPSLQARIYDWIKAGAPLALERVFGGGFEER